MQLSPAKSLLVSLSVFWIAALGCHTADLVARIEPTPAISPTRTVRPTFTIVPVVQAAPNVAYPPPQAPPIVVPPTSLPTAVATRAPTARPAPTRTRTPVPAPAAPPPPPPTADPQAGHFYRYIIRGCVQGDNTRIQGLVTDNGVPTNGITVRLSYEVGGPAVVDDFVTGTDPSDKNHHDAAFAGKYRLSPAEGARNKGDWFVFIVSSTGDAETMGAYIHTDDVAGCNTATVDFVHP